MDIPRISLNFEIVIKEQSEEESSLKILSRTGRLGNSSINYEFRDKLLYSNGGSHPSGLLRRSELQRGGGTQILFNGVSSYPSVRLFHTKGRSLYGLPF